MAVDACQRCGDIIRLPPGFELVAVDVVAKLGCASLYAAQAP